MKIKTTKISSGSDTGESTKFCTSENSSLYDIASACILFCPSANILYIIYILQKLMGCINQVRVA